MAQDYLTLYQHFICVKTEHICRQDVLSVWKTAMPPAATLRSL